MAYIDENNFRGTGYPGFAIGKCSSAVDYTGVECIFNFVESMSVTCI